MDYTDNPYDEEDPRYDEFELACADTFMPMPLVSMESDPFIAAEAEYQRIYGGGPEPVRARDYSHAGDRDERHRSVISTAIDWSM